MKMEINEFVVDSELFSKINSEGNNCETILQLIHSKIKNGDFSVNDMNECICFVDILKAIINKKCVFAYNDEIKTQCIETVKKCPDDIKIMFMNILGNSSHCKKIDSNFDYRKKSLFIGTPLESKIQFINVAYHLNNKLIISTKEEIDTKYKDSFYNLCLVEVACKNVCEVKEEIYG